MSGRPYENVVIGTAMRWGWAIVACVLAGCGAEVASAPTVAAPDMDAGLAPTLADDAGVPAAVTSSPPMVAITSPADGASLTDPAFRVEGTSSDLTGVASVFISIGPNVPLAAKSIDGYRTWSFDAVAPPGVFDVSAIAYDVTGAASEPASITIARPTTASDELAPVVTVTSPDQGSTPAEITALVRGTAKDDLTVVRMEVRRDGELLDERPIGTDDFFANWSRLVTLLPGKTNTLEFKAYDNMGNSGVATLRLVGRAEADRYAPTISITSPVANEIVNTDKLKVTGQAFDNLAVREVKVRVRAGEGGAFGDYVKATTTDAFAHWTISLPIDSGPVTIQARAIDVSGLAANAEITFQNAFKAEWGSELVIPLRVNEGAPARLSAKLDRPGVNAVINAATQKQTRILTLDPTNLVTNALTTIKSACGTDWQRDTQYPNYDCNLTALGKTFRGPDGTWRSSPEFALVRLLTMTPANVLSDGTSIAGLRDLANLLGIGGGFNQILAETLGISRTTTVVGTPAVTAALVRRFLASHPYLAATNGSIPVTLYDAMNDMAPLGGALGPVPGVHPGVADPGFPPRSVVLTPAFQLLLVAVSNLRWFDGVMLGTGKEYISFIVDTTGPTFDDVLEFDFNDPTRFDITGLAASPTLDLRLKLYENPAYVPTCTNGAGYDCVNNTPTSPVGTGYVWSTPVFQLENIIGYSGYQQYQTRDNYHRCYAFILPCVATVGVGNGAQPAGWMQMDTTLNLGNPPRDQYLWELLGEVAQRNLHNFTVGGLTTTLAEGTVNPAFTLSGIPIGITPAQIRAQMGPALQSQRAMLSKNLLGDYSKNNGNVDFYLRKGADGARYLHFVAASDPRPTAAYSYTKPGFFSDAGLTQKISSKAIPASGDSVHEKLALPPGERTVYVQDSTGRPYRLRITVPAQATADVEVRVARRTL